MHGSLSRAVSLTAPAKINLALHVTGRRDDGYHLLDSLVVFAGFGDTVAVRHAERDSFELSGRYGHDLPAGDGNLVLGARDLLRAAFPERALPVAIHLDKRLPIASGIGGGSSDAAATLRALAALWGIDAGTERLSALGLAIGADVPMCLHAKPLIARGIGEKIEPVAAFPHLPMVLVNNGMPVSTPRVFAALKQRDNPALPNLPVLRGAMDLHAYLAHTHNHLYPAAAQLVPAIDDALDALRATDPRLARMSGSGATCFALYDSDEAAGAAAAWLRQSHPAWFVVATHSVSEGI